MYDRVLLTLFLALAVVSEACAATFDIIDPDTIVFDPTYSIVTQPFLQTAGGPLSDGSEILASFNGLTHGIGAIAAAASPDIVSLRDCVSVASRGGFAIGETHTEIGGAPFGAFAPYIRIIPEDGESIGDPVTAYLHIDRPIYEPIPSSTSGFSSLSFDARLRTNQGTSFFFSEVDVFPTTLQLELSIGEEFELALRSDAQARFGDGPFGHSVNLALSLDSALPQSLQPLNCATGVWDILQWDGGSDNFTIVNPQIAALGSRNILSLGSGEFDSFEFPIPSPLAHTADEGFAIIGEDGDGNLVVSLPAGLANGGILFSDLFPSWTVASALNDPSTFLQDPAVIAILQTPFPEMGSSTATDIEFFAFEVTSGAGDSAGMAAMNPVPEPSTFALGIVGLGVLGLLGLRRRNRYSSGASSCSSRCIDRTS